ncbi:hypothetical protein N7466_003343 [Penicillium verhagenii]|uniref:uncharacterized protein n=1 Tax=Penicillium verhagenii TaxID=1562060 RepID=UPI0025453A73|nr:uncharacterized protein N7466_003343 [Penicillium verhagenii]KAJ5936893.1 hypothetical protein N7466_003343 [Penicillium verhagenii]
MFLQDTSIRMMAWTTRGCLQGHVGTDIWILASECGQVAFSLPITPNGAIGWALYSSPLMPEYSRKISHAWTSLHWTHEQDTTGGQSSLAERIVAEQSSIISFRS